MHSGKLMIFFLLILILGAAFFGYKLVKRNITPLTEVKNSEGTNVASLNPGMSPSTGAEVKNSEGTSIPSVSPGTGSQTETKEIVLGKEFIVSLNQSGSESLNPVDIEKLDSETKKYFAQVISPIPLKERMNYLVHLRNLYFYDSDGKFYFYHKSLPFELSKIDMDEQKIRMFHACSLPRIKGTPRESNPYLKEKQEVLDKFYASDWKGLEASTDNLAKVLSQFHKNGHCDITDEACVGSKSVKKMRDIIEKSMMELQDYYEVPTNEIELQNQIDLYLACTLPKYTKSVDKLLPYFNQIGPIPALLGVDTDTTINNFYNALQKKLLES